MSTDLAVIEAALKERQPRFDPCGTCRYCGIRKATGWSEPRDAGGSFVATCAECFIPGPNAYLAELVERVKAAEAAIERVRATGQHLCAECAAEQTPRKAA